jgi:hypothetical protein
MSTVASVNGSFYPATTATTVSIASNAAITGPVVIGSEIDTNGYEYVMFHLLTGTVTGSGSIYIEYSVDNNRFGRISGDMSSYLTTSVVQTDTFLKVNPNGARYVRLWADTGVATTATYLISGLK